MTETVGGEVRRISFPIEGDLSEMRRRAREFLAIVAFDEFRETNFILAISEAANNVLDHAGTDGLVTLRCDADRVVAEIRDEAGVLTDTEAGRTPPPVGSRRGYGIWLMREMCDEVEISQERGASTVRLTMMRP
ncbi:ATP-binding protein [Streptosporangium sp. NPDC051022]|uniref:ATP-binding protein n=1 Tax=Streptosporangium sp. NPDC051022 TaxID=3155752 RepID=UPI003441D8E2